MSELQREQRPTRRHRRWKNKKRAGVQRSESGSEIKAKERETGNRRGSEDEKQAASQSNTPKRQPQSGTKKEKNIVLIGMPGSGKSTVGRVLAKKLHRPFIDLDRYLEKKYGRHVNEIFDESEGLFRSYETQVCKECRTLEGTIIATGGGVVTNPENIALLKENGILVLINRSIEEILKHPRIYKRAPLRDGAHKVYEVYRERMPLYTKYADYIIRNRGNMYGVVKQIMHLRLLNDTEQKKRPGKSPYSATRKRK